jgi:hypothetical protein
MMFRLILLLAPTLLGAGALWFLATDPMTGAMIGAVAGFVVGVALNAFPNLDQSASQEDTDLPLIDP